MRILAGGTYKTLVRFEKEVEVPEDFWDMNEDEQDEILDGLIRIPDAEDVEYDILKDVEEIENEKKHQELLSRKPTEEE